MSYDGWIVDAAGDVITDLGNYTSNVSRMWRWCLSMVRETPTRLSDTEGWTCREAAPVLTKAVSLMERERPRLEQWNPENGWGDYDGALEYLQSVARWTNTFAEVPGARLHWSA